MRHSLILWVVMLMIFGGHCSGPVKTDVPDKPTYAEHIEPIIRSQCVSCHHNGGAAPFSLQTYEEVKRKSKTIARVTAKRYMPPWPADPEYAHFINEKVLTKAEIEIIQRWAETGAAPGDLTKVKPYELPAWKSAIGKPDLVLPIEEVEIEPNMRDRFFLVKIPGLLSRDTWVRAVEFVAGSPDLVHHFNGHILMYENDQKKNHQKRPYAVEITTGEYDSDFGKLDLLNDDGTKPFRLHSAVNYLPGVQGIAYPNGIGAFRLSRRFTVVGNDLHYGPSNRKTRDRSYINLFFTDKPPSRLTKELMLGTNGVSGITPPLLIAPNSVSKHTTRFQIDRDISLLTVNPHLHLLGKHFTGYAIKPNGDTVKLIQIPQWDFRWQYFYTYPNPVYLPAGTIVVAEAVFDNTAGNPNNPNQPPKQVGERMEYGGASMRAGDEMFQFILTYMDYQKGDEKISLEKGKK